MFPAVNLVVTCGLGPFVRRAFEEGSLTPGLRLQLSALTDRLIKQLGAVLSNRFNLLALNAEELARELQVVAERDLFAVVSLDDTHLTWARHYLHLTNVAGPNGDVEWVSKPGRNSLEQQIAKLRELGAVTLADLGAQRGQTLLTALDLLMAASIPVKGIYLGLCSPGVTTLLAERVSNVTTIRRFDFLLWVELKDLLGLDGRLVRCQDGRIRRMTTWDTLLSHGPFDAPERRAILELCTHSRGSVIRALETAGLDPSRLPAFAPA